MTTALELDLKGLAALLVFDHCRLNAHHSRLCDICRRAHELGIKPEPLASDEGLMCDIQRHDNAQGDGYFGAFDGRGPAATGKAAAR